MSKIANTQKLSSVKFFWLFQVFWQILRIFPYFCIKTGRLEFLDFGEAKIVTLKCQKAEVKADFKAMAVYSSCLLGKAQLHLVYLNVWVTSAPLGINRQIQQAVFPKMMLLHFSIPLDNWQQFITTEGSNNILTIVTTGYYVMNLLSKERLKGFVKFLKSCSVLIAFSNCWIRCCGLLSPLKVDRVVL